MKINRKDQDDFLPVTISITFESQKEMVALYMIFNHSYILHAEGIEGVLYGEDFTGAIPEVGTVYENYWGAFSESLDRRFKGGSHES